MFRSSIARFFEKLVVWRMNCIGESSEDFP